MTTKKGTPTMATPTTAEIIETAPPIELDLDRAPDEPTWLREGRSAILGCETLAELDIACRPLRTLSASQRDRLRPIKESHERKLRAAVRAELGITVAPISQSGVPAPQAVVGSPAAPVVACTSIWNGYTCVGGHALGADHATKTEKQQRHRPDQHGEVCQP